MRYRPEIDGLRAVAVLSVIAYHAGFGAVSGGFVGVDIFFVISGYLITGIIFNELRAGNFSILTFYERRARRILPPLVFMSAVLFGLCCFHLLPYEFKDFGRSLAAMATFWANVFFYKQSGYFDATAESKPLLHTWSLSVEEQFYIFLPLLMWLVYKKWRNSLFFILSFCAAVSLLLSIVRISNHPESAFYLIRFRAWELLAGSLLAVCPFRRFTLADKGLFTNICSLAALFLLFTPVFLYSKTTVFPGVAALVPVAGAALFLQLGVRGFAGKVLNTTIPVFIGKISYPLYLWHWPLLVIPALVFDRPLSPKETLISLSLTFMCSVFSWRFIENPIRSKRVLASRRQLFAVSLSAIALLTVGGRLVKVLDGWPGRFPAYIMKYYNVAESFHECLKGGFSADFNPCIIGPEKGPKPSFLLWGDSHAAAQVPGLREMTEEYGERGLQYTMANCGPLIGFEMAHFNSARRQVCRNFNDNVRNIILDNGIKHVVLGATFGSYLSSEIQQSQYGNTPMDVSYFREHLAETIQMLRGLGVTVWVIEGVPWHERPVPQHLGRTLLRGGDIKDVALDRRDYEEFYGPVEDALGNFAHDIKVLPLSPPMCNAAKCFPADDNGAYYSDTNHLSAFGAKHMKNTFRPLFEAIAGRSPAPTDASHPIRGQAFDAPGFSVEASFTGIQQGRE